MTKVVFRIEIASLLNENGQIDPKKLGRLAMLCTDLSNGGFKISIVSLQFPNLPNDALK